MQIYFLRHADAVYEGERPLSDKGRKQMHKVAAFAKRAQIEVSALLTSPLLRATETADLIAPTLGLTPEVTPALSCGTDIAGLQELLSEFPQDSAIMLVGHEPDFSELIEELTGGQVDVKKASIALVECDEVDEGAGILRWLVPPKLM